MFRPDYSNSYPPPGLKLLLTSVAPKIQTSSEEVIGNVEISLAWKLLFHIDLFVLTRKKTIKNNNIEQYLLFSNSGRFSWYVIYHKPEMVHLFGWRPVGHFGDYPACVCVYQTATDLLSLIICENCSFLTCSFHPNEIVISSPFRFVAHKWTICLRLLVLKQRPRDPWRRIMLWFNFVPGLKFIFLCSKPTFLVIHYDTQKQRIIKIKQRIKLNHNIMCEERGALILIASDKNWVCWHFEATGKLNIISITMITALLSQ